MLKAWGATAFHATDFYSGAKEFKRNTVERKRLFEEDSKRIPRMIGACVQRILIVSFKPDGGDPRNAQANRSLISWRLAIPMKAKCSKL